MSYKGGRAEKRGLAQQPAQQAPTSTKAPSTIISASTQSKNTCRQPRQQRWGAACQRSALVHRQQAGCITEQATRQLPAGSSDTPCPQRL